ncbi:hypothetical protein ACWGDX_13235 [Streptomyces sp. NPDC055025]
MWSAIVAVVGTLLGAVVAGGMQHLAAALARRDQRRREVAAAAEGLLGAATDHRSHQYLKRVARRDGLPDTGEAREKRYAAHSATTKAMTALMVATSDRRLISLARDLVNASFALGDADDLDAAGDLARHAHNAFQTAVADYIHN